MAVMAPVLKSAALLFLGQLTAVRGAKTCAIHEYVDGAKCEMCPAGKQAKPGQVAGHSDEKDVACVTCPAGKFKAAAGATACVECTDADKGVNEARTTCAQCPIDHYKHTNKVCIECPKLTGSGVGSVGIDKCKAKDCTTHAPDATGSHTKCKTCTAKFFDLKDGLCVNKCTCSNGTPAADCEKAEVKCTACDANSYKKDAACEKCPALTSSSSNSVGIEKCKADDCQTLASASANAAQKCTQCKPNFFDLKDGLCKSKCTCKNGTPAKDCSKAAEKCSECNEFFKADKDTCVTKCTCKSGKPANDCKEVKEKCAPNAGSGSSRFAAFSGAAALASLLSAPLAFAA